jgi:hypothetical protein
MCAWSANPVCAATLASDSEPCMMRSHASRVRNSARKTDGGVPYAAMNPRDSSSRDKPFVSAHDPKPVEAFAASCFNNKSGQSFFSLGDVLHFRSARCRRKVASTMSFSAACAISSTSAS